MRRVPGSVFGLAMALSFAFGCSSDSDKADTTYARLGGHEGVNALSRGILEKVYADPKINGYFLNAPIDQAHLEDCIAKQIATATGGAKTYDCRSMKEAHAGLGISKQDFEDFTADVSAALDDAKVSDKDKDTIVAVLSPLSDDIVEDESNDATLYQQLGRKPAIAAVIHAFIGKVAADTRINAFFADTHIARIEQCLVRQVCDASGGPCQYGQEVLDGTYASDESTDILSECRDMKKTHMGLDIAYADFGALVEDLVKTLDENGVPASAKEAILSVLGPLCPDIVEKDSCG